MTTLWISVSIVLGVFWLIMAVGVTCSVIADEGPRGLRGNEYKTFTAVMAGLALFVFFHWIILLVALFSIVPAFIIYGCWQAVRRPWRKIS